MSMTIAPGRALTSSAQLGPTGARLVFLPHLLTLAATLVILVYIEAEPGLDALAVTATLFAIAVTLRSGGAYLTPSGVFVMAAGVFVGGACYYLGRVETNAGPEDIRNAAVLALVTTIGMSFVATALSIRWRTRWRSDPSPRDDAAPDFHPPRQFAVRALVLLVASQLPPVIWALGPLAPGLGLVGVLMLALAASTRRLRMRWQGDVVLVALVFVAPAIWVAIDFSGGGRLQVAGVGVAAFMGWNLVRPHPYQKVAVILCIPVFLVLAGHNRLDQGEDETSVSSSSVISDGKGLGSVYSPLATWGEIIEAKTPEQEALLGPRRGETFLNTLTLPVPRGLWEDKPVGFGRELVIALEVEGVSENHSIAALIQGEWYANFGYAGLVWMVPVMGWLLAWLDRAHARLCRSRLQRPADWWKAVALMGAVSSLADLYWVGSFTWLARGGLAALLALAIGQVSLGRVRHPTPDTPLVSAP